jgi:hypothetical protein
MASGGERKANEKKKTGNLIESVMASSDNGQSMAAKISLA